MPAPAPPFGPVRPGEDNTAALDPCVSILGQFFRALLEHYCGPAWESIAPNEPVVRVLKTGYDPEDLDFSVDDLPLFAVWRAHDGVPSRFSDGNAQTATEIHMLWVAPPADDQKLAARSPFFRAFTAAMLHAYKNERDPCWVRVGDENSAPARTYGSYVWGLAGIDSWTYQGTKRVPVQVGVGEGQRPEMYAGFLSTWQVLESTALDPAELGSTVGGVRVGTGSTSVFFNLTDRDSADPNALIRQSALVDTDDT